MTQAPALLAFAWSAEGKARPRAHGGALPHPSTCGREKVRLVWAGSDPGGWFDGGWDAT